MRRVPHGVAVLTVDVDGERLGLTLDSLVSLSLDPPLVGVSISRQAAMHELLREAGAFALSLLAGDQAAVAQHFARGVPPIARWHGIATRPGAAAAADRRRARLARVPAGGRASRPATTRCSSARWTRSRPATAPPLVHVQSGYRSL